MTSRSYSLKYLKSSSFSAQDFPSILEKKTLRQILYREEADDKDCVRKCRIIQKRHPKLRSFILRMFKADLTAISNYEDLEDIIMPRPREVSTRWLSSMKQISGFELYLPDSRILDSNLKTLARTSIQHFKNLKSLTLFIEGGNVNDSLLITFSFALRHLNSLESFAIDTTSTNVTDLGICTLASKCLHKFKKLKKLDLGLGGNPLTDKSVFSLVNNAFIYMNDMVDFQLCLWHSELTDKGLMELSNKVLSKWTTLKKLQLFFSGTHITDEGVNNLIIESLVHMRELRFLELGLNYTNITNTSVINLSKKALKNMSFMRTLSLNLSSNEINGAAITALADHAFHKMKKLQDLKLSLGDIDIRDKDFSKLATFGIPKCPELKMLVLDLMEDSTLSNAILRDLSEYVLDHSEKLEMFRIFLNDNPRINDGGLIDFTRTGLYKLTKMKKIVLGIGNTRITDKGVRILCEEGLSQMKELEECELDIWAIRITDDSIYALCDTLKGFRKLKKLKLYVNETHVTDDAVYELFETLSHIRAFNILIIDVSASDVTIREQDLPGLSEKYGFKIKYPPIDE
jgi:hypothetical protein